MGFATSFKFLTHSGLKNLSFMPATGLDQCTESVPPSAQPSAPLGQGFGTPQAAPIRIPFMRANRSRSRPSNTTAQHKTPRTELRPDSILAIKTTQNTSQKTLKIVQREPREHPECLLISGRMADVYAALESMERAEQAGRKI